MVISVQAGTSPKPLIVSWLLVGGQGSCSQDVGLWLNKWAESRAGTGHHSALPFATGVPRCSYPKLRRCDDEALALSPESHRDQQVGVGPSLLLPCSCGYRGQLGSCPRLWRAMGKQHKRGFKEKFAIWLRGMQLAVSLKLWCLGLHLELQPREQPSQTTTQHLGLVLAISSSQRSCNGPLLGWKKHDLENVSIFE